MDSKRVENKTPADSLGGTLTISLFSPGMTVFHKVGLAGLWMTLEALEDKSNSGSNFPDGSGSWERTQYSVTLRWNRAPDVFFKTLFEKSFRIDKNGLFWFPALGDPVDNPSAVTLQEAVLGSFLQHGRTRKSDPSQKPGGNLSFTVDDSTFVMQFHRVMSYQHQNARFDVVATNPVAGWLFPGGTVRHTGLGQDMTPLEESPGRSLALRYAIVGAIYFKINSYGVGSRPRYCLVLPEIGNLEKYAQARRVFISYGISDLQSSGTADAGFRVLAQLEAQKLIEDLSMATCRVISFGTMPWSSQQKTRVSLMTVHANSYSDLRIFTFCRHMFRARLVRPKKGDPFWDIPQTPDIVANNLIAGHRWWKGFANETDDKLRREHIFNYEKGGLIKMVESTETFPEGPERIFVLACHEAWRRRMGQLSDKAKREKSSFTDQVDREFERTCISFSHCKNADSLREAVIDFWSRGGGPLKSLQEGWHDVLTLLDEDNWRKGRDLALLALASYKPATKEEEKALSQETKGGKQNE